MDYYNVLTTPASMDALQAFRIIHQSPVRLRAAIAMLLAYVARFTSPIMHNTFIRINRSCPGS